MNNPTVMVLTNTGNVKSVPVPSFAAYIGVATAGVLNVKSYGAKGDGITDDTVAIQAAFTAVQQYQTIYFPYGTYMVSNLKLGAVPWVTITGDRAVLKSIPGTNGPMLDNNGGYFCTVMHLIFDGNKDNQPVLPEGTVDTRDGLVFKWAFFTVVQDCLIRWFKRDGVHFIAEKREDGNWYNVDECKFINNYVQGNGRDGIWLASAQENTIIGSSFEYNGRHGMLFEDNTTFGGGNSVISACSFVSNDDVGIKMERCTRNKVIGCHITFNGGRGMEYIMGYEGIINGNNFHLNGRLHSGSEGVVIAYNKNMLFTNNNVSCTDATPTQGKGLQCWNVENIRVKDNIFVDNIDTPPVSLNDCTGVICRDNIGQPDIISTT